MTDVLDTDDADVDYITLTPTVSGQRFLAVIYKHVGNGDYTQSKVSSPMDRTSAERVAGLWSVATGLTIRL